jgi:hypothetical protein
LQTALANAKYTIINYLGVTLQRKVGVNGLG